eukprot:MONOS_16114.1-p1 / transcript=MONOS_16114.1 / gene=MONOS_16114 / organism=Monocercomonoides_exilis_PA203 / gene_product=unspecified product / transcript_product=unspecified product / location=Mono_scaffold01511:7964-8627(+) / protein_length=162 / sequence_SO=supercontig / SO=protein_coding / is_pseudo=false
MDARHKWVIQRVSELFHCESSVIEGLVNDEGLIPQMTKFFNDPQEKKMLFYQQGESPMASYSAQIGEENEGVEPLVETGLCVYVLRTGKKAIPPANFEFEMLVGSFPANYLLSFVDVLKEVMIPALDAQDAWGETSKSEVGSVFLYDANRFATNMQTTAKSL